MIELALYVYVCICVYEVDLSPLSTADWMDQ